MSKFKVGDIVTVPAYDKIQRRVIVKVVDGEYFTRCLKNNIKYTYPRDEKELELDPDFNTPLAKAMRELDETEI